jgi:hypothetical protein
LKLRCYPNPTRKRGETLIFNPNGRPSLTRRVWILLGKSRFRNFKKGALGVKTFKNGLDKGSFREVLAWDQLDPAWQGCQGIQRDTECPMKESYR